jgi:hypothetical protein
MALNLAELETWLAGKTSLPVQLNRLQQTPDNVVAVSAPGSMSPMYDAQFEAWRLEVRVRGGDDLTAETNAKAIHAVFVAASSSFLMGATHVVGISVQSAPVYSGRDQDNRTVYRSLYQIVVPV